MPIHLIPLVNVTHIIISIPTTYLHSSQIWIDHELTPAAGVSQLGLISIWWACDTNGPIRANLGTLVYHPPTGEHPLSYGHSGV